MFHLSDIVQTSLATLFMSAAVIGFNPSANAQVCPSSANTFWKVDALADNPTGTLTISVVPGLCEGEGIANVFELNGSGPQRLTQVVCPFGANGGVNGFTASVNIQIFDGVSFSGANNKPTLGPKIFDLAAGSSANMQVTSTGFNVFDMTPFNVVVGENGNSSFVVAFTMEINPNGDCTNGYNANFFTDNTQFLFNCDPQITPEKTSLMLIQGQGWTDVSKATIGGIPICPFFYSGVWGIRACTESAGPQNPLHITASPNPIPVGGSSAVVFHAPGFEGDFYFAIAGLGTSPGISTNFGVIPITLDPLTHLALNSPGNFINFSGQVNAASGNGLGLMVVPNSPAVSGFSFYIAFIAAPNGPGTIGISDALKITIQ